MHQKANCTSPLCGEISQLSSRVLKERYKPSRAAGGSDTVAAGEGLFVAAAKEICWPTALPSPGLRARLSPRESFSHLFTLAKTETQKWYNLLAGNAVADFQPSWARLRVPTDRTRNLAHYKSP